MAVQQATRGVLDTLAPRPVWGFFEGLNAHPRASKQEERVREHVRRVVEQHGLKAKIDALGNMLVEVPASPGHEKAAPTVLQAHLDMVCEKNSGHPHDFDREGIKMLLDQDAAGEQIVRADGTTLGADNGIGVSLALAAATSKDVVRGPLELLFTIDEEAGMSGAKGLAPGFFKGKRLLNLDSEEDDRLYIGCAGGCDTNLTWKLPLTATEGGELARVSVSGLRGGHSGCDIHEGRGHAVKLLARTLLRAATPNLRIVEITGGSKRNAIPREARAVVHGQAGILAALSRAAHVVQKEALQESNEKGAKITVERAPATASSLGLAADATTRFLAAIAGLPQGVLGLHPTVPGLVETSNNVATIEWSTGGGTASIEVGNLSRSSSRSRLSELVEQIAAIGRLAGANVTHGSDYPPWEPNPSSPLLDTCKRVYRELFHEDAHVAAIHAGLETGIIGERMGAIDMVSLGPRITGAHSPDERVYVRSVEKSWRLLLAILKELAK